MAGSETDVHGERVKSRFETPGPDRRDEQSAFASQDPLLPREAAASITEATSGLSCLHRSVPRRQAVNEAATWITWNHFCGFARQATWGEVVAKMHKKHRGLPFAPVEHTDEELHRRLKYVEQHAAPFFTVSLSEDQKNIICT